MQRSSNDDSSDALFYIVPSMVTLIVVSTVGIGVWFGVIRKKQKKRLGMAMTSSKRQIGIFSETGFIPGKGVVKNVLDGSNQHIGAK